jgi:hypothetical protein
MSITPLLCAIINDKIGAARLLLDHGANLSNANRLVYICVLLNKVEIMDLLTAYGIEYDLCWIIENITVSNVSHNDVFKKYILNRHINIEQIKHHDVINKLIYCHGSKLSVSYVYNGDIESIPNKGVRNLLNLLVSCNGPLPTFYYSLHSDIRRNVDVIFM